MALLNEEGASRHIAVLYSHAEGHIEWISGSAEEQLKANIKPDPTSQAFRVLQHYQTAVFRPTSSLSFH